MKPNRNLVIKLYKNWEYYASGKALNPKSNQFHIAYERYLQANLCYELHLVADKILNAGRGRLYV